MKTLVIDTAFKGGRIGLCTDGALEAEEEIDAGHLESQTFAALIKVGVQPDLDGVDLIALAAGPGSFTGLKIGAVVAKSLSFLQHKPFKGIGTLPWLAASGGTGMVLPCIKSHGTRFYWGLYEVGKDGETIEMPRELIAPKCTDSKGIMDAIVASGYKAPNTVLGFSGDDGTADLPWEMRKIDLQLSILAKLAEYVFAMNGSDDPLSFTPLYVARSQAEEKAGGPH